MTKEHKQHAVDIVKRHGSSWSAACLLELMEKLLVAQNELVSLQTCVWLAIEGPSHIEQGMEELEVEQDLPAEVVQAEASRKKATSDLKLFRCVPDGMTGIELFHHQIAFHQHDFC